MVSDGIKFYLSRNGVWLTKYVDPKYLLTSGGDCLYQVEVDNDKSYNLQK